MSLCRVIYRAWFAKSQFTARKPPEKDAGPQRGKRSNPFTRVPPDWKLAIHAGLLHCSPRAGRWLKRKPVNGSWWQLTVILAHRPINLADNQLKSKKK
jgi:hypothetical protein